MIPVNPALYVRISDDREGDAKGVGRQLEDGFALAEGRGWPKPAVYNDNDKSAWKRTVVRDDFRRLLDDIASGSVDALIVYDSDRFYRQPRELEEFLDVCEGAKVTELTQVTGDVDLGSTDGRLTLRIKAAVAVKESDDKSRRIKRKALELAKEGKVGGGGTRPFGFEQDRVTVRPDEAVVIVELKDRCLAGESLRSLCFDLNARGIPTSTGGEWVQTVLRRMLRSARISGRREHKGEIVADAEWPAIISPADSDRLRAVLADPTRRKNERARSYLLAGLLVCGHCDEAMTSRPRSDGRRRYVCARRPGSSACGRMAILSEEVEELVVEMVFQRLEGPALAQALAAKAGSREEIHQQTIDEANAQLEELAALYAGQQISASEWMAARNPIDERLRQAKVALARTTGTSALEPFEATPIRTTWPDLSLSRKRAILFAVFEAIAINSAVRGRSQFDPSRVAPRWRV
jgi:DNA invertase Pin-like site-specific DNA recombinase